MTVTETHHKDYWQAEGTVTEALARFEAATAKGRTDRQRSAFYRLAKYQGRTLRILHSAFDAQNAELARVALHNLMAIHRGMLQMHERAADVLPLPYLVREETREHFVADLAMRTLREAARPIDGPELVSRIRHLELLGDIAVADLQPSLDRLVAQGNLEVRDGKYTATRRTYTEVDINNLALRALMGPTAYEVFHAARIRRIGNALTRPQQFARTFTRATGLDDDLGQLMVEACEMLYTSSFDAARPWHYHDVVDSAFPRPYQREAYRVFRRNGYDNQVIEAPTGSGKTLIGMMCIVDGLRAMQRGQSILVLVPTSAYQQQWLAELCFHEIGLQLSPELVFTGTPSQLRDFVRRTGQHPPIVLLTYTSLSQLSSGIGKGGFDADSLEIFLQEANIQYVVLDEVHKVVADMQSVSTDVTRLLVEWRRDNSIRGLVGFSGTAEAFRARFAAVGLDLIHTIPIDDLVAAGFVAPFTELGVPFNSSAREQSIRLALEGIKQSIHTWFDLLGSERLRRWFAEIPLAERVRIGHDVLGMYKGRRDWAEALEARLREWEDGDALNFNELNLVLIVQIANGWADTDLAERAGLDPDGFDRLRVAVDAQRSDLRDLIYLPQSVAQLERPGFMTTLDLAALETVLTDTPVSRRGEAVKDVLATSLVGLYHALKGWYLRVGEGRVETIKAVIGAERELRDVTGTIVFDVGRRIHWRGGVANPGYEGVGGLFGQILGDRRFTVLAALSSELYMTHDEEDPLPDRIAEYIDERFLYDEAAEPILSLAIQGTAIHDGARAALSDLFRDRIAAYVPQLRDIRTPRPADFDRQVLRHLRNRVKVLDLGVDGDRILARLHTRNVHLRGLVHTFFDYAMLARYFRTARVAELEQVSGARQKFFVVPMPGAGDRKQLMYELTSHVVDEPSLPVNLIIVSSWARTGWNVISPNVLIDATATHDVTAWQQLRGRAIRADRRWTNDCYRLETMILDDDPLAFGGDDEGEVAPLDDALVALLREVAPRGYARRVLAEGFDVLTVDERNELASALMRRRNKVTHVYEMVKSFGSTSQVTLDRQAGAWVRKEGIAAKHAREVAVDPIRGEKSQDESHAPLLYVDDPRSDLPGAIGALLVDRLAGADERIVAGWLGFAGT